MNPEYNISQDPTAPMSGRTHSDESKTKISDAAKKSENSGRFKPGQQRPEGSGRTSQQIEVTDITKNTTIFYDSMHEAARELNLPNHTIILNYIKNNQKKPYKGKYTFNKIQES